MVGATLKEAYGRNTVRCAWCNSSQLRVVTRSGARKLRCKCGKYTTLRGSKIL